MPVDINGNEIVEEPTPITSVVSEQEISEMLEDIVGVTTTPTETPKLEEKPEGEEPKKEGEEPSSEVKKDAVVVEKPTEKVKVEEPVQLSEFEILKKQNETLLAQIEKLSGAASTTPEPVTELPKPPEIKKLEDLLGESLDFDKIMESKSEFVSFVLQMSQAIQEQTAQKILTNIPGVVGGFVQRQATLRDVAQNFFGQYPELKSVKRYVGVVANEISAEHADWNISQVLEATASKVKETLGLKAAVVAREKSEVVKPALPGGTGGGKAKVSQPTGLQAEIDDFLND